MLSVILSSPLRLKTTKCQKKYLGKPFALQIALQIDNN